MASLIAKSPTARLVIASLLLFFIGLFGGRRLAGDPDPTTAPPPPETTASPVADDQPGEPASLPSPVGFFGEYDPGPTPSGDGVIRGTVTTPDGRPLPGVTVRAEPEPPYDVRHHHGPPPPGDPQVNRVEAEVRSLLLGRRGTREAKTDDAGRFLFTGISDLEHRISGYKAGYEIRRVGRGSVLAGQEVHLVARPVVELEVRVLGPDGTPPDQARLKIRCTGRYVGRNAIWTPRRPRIDLDPGPIRIQAFAGDGDSLASVEVDRRLEVGVRPKPVVLSLVERTGIGGKLTFPPRGTWGHALYWIVALRVREDGNLDPSQLLTTNHYESRLGRTNPTRGYGRFSFTDLPAGTYLVGAIEKYKTVHDSRVVRVTSGMTTVDLAIPFPRAGEATTVRILDPSGKPVSMRDNVQIQARHVAADNTITSGSPADSLGDGEWRVPTPRIPAGGEAGGRFLLVVRAASCGSKTVEYAPGGSGEVEVRFAPPAALTVTLPNYPGSRYEGVAHLTLLPDRPREERNYAPNRKRPDPHGKATFTALAPGDWIIRLTVDIGEYGTRVVMEQPIRLTSGVKEETVLDPPALFDLTVEEPGEKGSFRLQPVAGGGWRFGHPASDGTVRFVRLLAGDYRLLRVKHRGFESMALEIDRDLIIRFTVGGSLPR